MPHGKHGPAGNGANETRLHDRRQGGVGGRVAALDRWPMTSSRSNEAQLSPMGAVPWTNALSKRLGDVNGPRITYAEAARYVRNQLRPYSLESVVSLSLSMLGQGGRGIAHLETWPWLTCLLVKLACQNRAMPLQGKPCPPHVFDRCRDALFRAQSSANRLDASQGSMYLTLRSLIQSQIAFQIKPNWGFLRFPALLRRLPGNHPTRQLFLQQFGMDPQDFICLSYVFMAAVLGDNKVVDPNTFSALRQALHPAMDRFFEIFSRDLQSLQLELQQELQERIDKKEDTHPNSEYNQFPWLSKYPLLRLANGSFAIWHPMVFARGLEDAVHRRLSLRAQQYASSFGKVFEDHVMEVLESSGKVFLTEEDYKSRHGADKNAVEAIITEATVNVFVESKLTAFSSSVTASGIAGVVWTGLKRVREAMKQGWMVSSEVRSGAFHIDPALKY